MPRRTSTAGGHADPQAPTDAKEPPAGRFASLALIARDFGGPAVTRGWRAATFQRSDSADSSSDSCRLRSRKRAKIETEPVEPPQRPDETVDDAALAAELGLEPAEQPAGADVEGFGASFADELEELASGIEGEGSGNGDADAAAGNGAEAEGAGEPAGAEAKSDE